MAANTAALLIRPILPADESGLRQFIRNLSLASRYMRFMVAMRELSGEMLDRFVHPQAGREAALVASSPTAGIVGLAQYVADEAGGGCEVAIVVGDAWQRQGLGTDLLTALMDLAGDNGVRHVHADALADNRAMRALACKLGCEVRTNRQAPFLVHISRPLESTRGTWHTRPGSKLRSHDFRRTHA
jgi:acetyltransferase